MHVKGRCCQGCREEALGLDETAVAFQIPQQATRITIPTLSTI